MTTSENIKEIKHSFLAFRNGIVSDTLRKAGMPYGIIFGLQLPQLAEIARRYDKSVGLADTLWNDTNVRESRLLACYLYPAEEIDYEKAHSLATSVLNVEEADILSFRLLRYLPFATRLADDLLGNDNNLYNYCGKALHRNLA